MGQTERRGDVHGSHATGTEAVTRLVARTVLDKIPDGEDRPRIAIETAEAWTRGEATLEQVYADAAAAYAAAYTVATYAAAYAAYYAAYAAYVAAASAAYASNAIYWAHLAGAPLKLLADIVRPLCHEVDQTQLTKLAESLGNQQALSLIAEWKAGSKDARSVLGDLFEELGYSV